MYQIVITVDPKTASASNEEDARKYVEDYLLRQLSPVFAASVVSVAVHEGADL